SLDCFFVALGEEAEKEAVRLMNDLRHEGIQVDKDYQGRGMRAQFRAADRLKAKYVLILGDHELEKNVINVREMESGDQKEVALEEIIQTMTEKSQGE